jgi:hypothetical protein
MRRQLGELGRDLVERKPYSLGEDYESDPTEHGSRIATLARSGTLGSDEPPILVES